MGGNIQEWVIKRKRKKRRVKRGGKGGRERQGCRKGGVELQGRNIEGE